MTFEIAIITDKDEHHLVMDEQMNEMELTVGDKDVKITIEVKEKE